MENEVLEKRKAALKKLLDNRQYFCSGFCHLIAILYARNALTYEESDLLDKLIDSYFENNEKARKAFRKYKGFMWEPGNWKEREKWVISTIESIDLMLNQSKTT